MKAWIYVHPAAATAAGASPPLPAPQRVCWYVGTSDEMVERALRVQLHVPRCARLLLRDADGDLVPVSAALPHDQHFSLVLSPPLPGDEDALQCGTCGSSSVIGDGSAEAASGRRGRKRRLPPDPVLEELHAPLEPMLPLPLPLPPPRRARTAARVVVLFLDVFTRPIADDDNVSFIPSTGRFALYALFCALVADRALLPKSQDAFYKMTSAQGKVDRLRAIRYYRGETGAYVRCKPQGKGLLLRRYLAVDSASALAAAARSAEALAALLGRDADETVARYMDFVRGFVPVSKAEFQAHCGRTSALGSGADARALGDP